MAMKKPPLEGQLTLSNGLDPVPVPETELTENDRQGAGSCCALPKPAGPRRKVACSGHRLTKWLATACLGSFI